MKKLHVIVRSETTKQSNKKTRLLLFARPTETHCARNGWNIIITLFMFGLMLSCHLGFADIAITTYYPSLSGIYDTFRLVPRSVNLSNPCTIGSLYVDASKTLNYCYNNSGTGTWGSVTDTWTQSGDNIYLTDITTQPNLRVGIGTKTPEFRLSIANDAGIIAKGTFGSGTLFPIPNPYLAGNKSRMIWYPRQAAFRAGYVSGTQWDNANIGSYSAALGKDSTASGNFSVVGGGDTNTVTNVYSSVIGGQNNSTNAQYSTIVGGRDNTINTFQLAIITGGQSNTASENSTTILGGNNNQAPSYLTVISGGDSNRVSSMYSNINGGQGNIIDIIAGGSPNGEAVIGGGLNNKSRNWASVVSGGNNNSAISEFSNIGGGSGNIVGFNYIPTGWQYSSITGGQNNTISNSYATISGGQNNTVLQDFGIIGGGLQNTASGIASAVGGGEHNTASGLNSIIIGGTNNIAGGDYSSTGGKNMQLTATADRTFAWGYSDTPISITQSDAFIISAGTKAGFPWNPKVGIRDINPSAIIEINANTTSDDYIEITRTNPGDIFVIKNNGYIGIGRASPSISSYALQVGTNGTNGNGAYLSGSGQWLPPCSRKLKENIHPLTSKIAEETLENLNPVTFNYKINDQTNTGFIAEDVPEIVALEGRQALSAMDIIAVLTKAAQDQQIQINQQAQEILEIQNTVNKLKRKSQK